MKNNLKPIGQELAILYASQTDGEEFHPDYKKNPEIFRKIVKSDVSLERNFKSYLKSLSIKVDNNMDWKQYDKLKAYTLDDLVSVDWDEEKINVKVLLTESLIAAINAGGEFSQEELGINIGWTSKDPPMIDFLNKYSLKLAGNLQETTTDAIKQAIKVSIANGDSQDDAAARINAIIDNPVRAKAIAHTEAIRAFSGGRLEVGRQVGADRKEWSATLNACSICQPLNGIVVPIDALFPGGYFSAPAHANCRCIQKLLMPESGEAAQNDFDLLDVWKDYPFN